jgi:predicted transcriptional regulator of viral defense system
MKLIDVLTKLKALNLPVIQTNDAAAYLNISVNHANKLLSRISATKQITHIKHGGWAFPDTDPLVLPSFLTAPFPSYVSLQTALYFHNMISQIPSIIYIISVELPKHFNIALANKMIRKITSTRNKTLVQRLFSEFITRIATKKSDTEY